MAQQPNLGHTHPCKPQPLIVYSHNPSTLYGASVPARPGMKSEKGDSVASDLAPRPLEDCPDGGHGWSEYFWVRLLAYMVGIGDR
jgi:hypothetical protein